MYYITGFFKVITSGLKMLIYLLILTRKLVENSENEHKISLFHTIIPC